MRAVHCHPLNRCLLIPVKIVTLAMFCPQPLLKTPSQVAWCPEWPALRERVSDPEDLFLRRSLVRLPYAVRFCPRRDLTRVSARFMSLAIKCVQCRYSSCIPLPGRWAASPHAPLRSWFNWFTLSRPPGGP